MPNLPRALFITYNGHGLGHLTRMMAIGKHARERFVPLFLTLSEAFPLLCDQGFVNEYMSSFEKLGMTKEEWEPLFASRLAQLLESSQPRVVIFDLVRPPAILAELRSGSTGFDLIWSRRGMWERRRNRVSIDVGRRSFDIIVEPGDIALPVDLGRTTDDRNRVTSVSPIVLMGPEEQEGRLEARRALGLPEDGRAILVNVSDSTSDRLAGLIATVRDAVTSVAGHESIHMFAPLHPLHRETMPSVSGVVIQPVYPLAKYIRAFDGIVSTAGYNSFHETVASGLPAVFVPRDSPSLDDQRKRALFAELCGRAFFVETFEDAALTKGIEMILEPEEAEVALAVTTELGAFTGGMEFADLISTRCRALGDTPYRVSYASEPPKAAPSVLERLPSGHNAEPGYPPHADWVIVAALGRDDSALGGLLADLTRIQQRTQSFKPVLLVDNLVDGQALNDEGFQFETIMSIDESAAVGIRSYQTYVEDRLVELRRRFDTDQVVVLAPEEGLDESRMIR